MARLVPSDGRFQTVVLQPGDRVRMDRKFLVKIAPSELSADIKAVLRQVSNSKPTTFKLDAFSNILTVLQATDTTRVNGDAIGADHSLKIGDRVNFVEDSILTFVVSSATDDATTAAMTAPARASGKRAIDDEEAGAPPPAKRAAVAMVRSPPAAPLVAPRGSLVLVPALRGTRLPPGWRAFDDSLLVWSTGAQRAPRASARIAGFDFDDTVATYNKADPTQWEMVFPHVPAVMRRLDADGFQIVIVSNQARAALCVLTPVQSMGGRARSGQPVGNLCALALYTPGLAVRLGELPEPARDP